MRLWFQSPQVESETWDLNEFATKFPDVLEEAPAPTYAQLLHYALRSGSSILLHNLEILRQKENLSPERKKSLLLSGSLNTGCLAIAALGHQAEKAKGSGLRGEL